MIPVPYTFHLKPLETVQAVNLAGTFNGWNKDATPMVLGPDGTWTVTVRLEPGKYQYKFVLDHERWITDPLGTNVEDGNGNTNSSITILPPGYDQPALRDDDRITAGGISHSTEVPDLNWDRGRLTISLMVRPNDVERVSVEVNGVPYRMTKLDSNDFAERWRAEVPWDRKTDLEYRFALTGSTTWVYGPDGVTVKSARGFQVKAATFKPVEVPTWVERSVLYQIFPDRFADGDPANDPRGVQPWSATPTYSNRFGGDFAGVSQRIPYLRDLHVGAIYFNPIFWSSSNHRYETKDYYQVDPELGTNQQFIDLTHRLRQSGIRTVLDGVFNHTDPTFFAFRDVIERGEASPYKTWYFIKSYPVKVGPNPNYEAWFNYPSMPKLNVTNPAAAEYLAKVPVYWQQHADIAGWRLDTANEVSMDYWRKFRRAVKGQDSQAWIVGEHWGDSTPWLKGDQWDAAMNYPFREAILQLVGKGRSGRPSTALGLMMQDYSRYAPQVSRNMMNLIGSHDTARILTECGGDRDLAKLAAIIEFTWVGAPTIYYGDELGMEGGPDPDNRRAMRWDLATPDNSFLSLYRTLAKLRTESKVLQSGDPVILLADDENGVGAFGRRLDDQFAVVAFNRSESAQTAAITIPLAFRHLEFKDALSGQSLKVDAAGKISIPLAPKRAAIIMPLSGVTSRPRLRDRYADSEGAMSLTLSCTGAH